MRTGATRLALWSVMFVSLFKFPNALKLMPKVPQVKTLVVMSDKIPEHEDCGVKIVTAQEIYEMGETGKGFTAEDLPDEKNLALIMYTSGSTGDPKGCMLTNANVVAGAAGLSCVNMSCSPKDTFMSFLPLAHIYAQAVEIEVIAHGGRVAYARGPVNYLLDDIQTMQPTIMIAVPRILNRVADAMKEKIKQLPGFMQSLLKYLMAKKSQCAKDNKPVSLLLDALLFSKFKAALGGRVKVIVSGGAPIMPEVFEFLTATITPNILQGCGMTELSSACFVQELPVSDPDTVGIVCPTCEIKLRRVAEMDYNPQDPDEPSGEVLTRGANLFQGYYKQPELTAEAMVDGWFCTGDIVKITKQKQVKIIDRAKQLVKLSQGEYVSLTTLTECYQLAPACGFIYVHADSKHGEPIAIVWPKPSYIEKWTNAGIKDIENSQVVHDEIVADLAEVHKFRQLRGFEKIKHVLVRLDEPTVENGLLTPSLKAQLNKIKIKYLDELNALYQEIDKQSQT